MPLVTRFRTAAKQLLDPNPSGSLVFRYYFSPSVGYWVTPAGTLPLGGWHMVFLQYSSASAAANPEISP